MKNFDVYLKGNDASQQPALIDWKNFYYDVVVPTYRRQPSIAIQIVKAAKPSALDGTTEAELYTVDDVSEPGYDMEPKENDDQISGTPAKVKLPQIYKTISLTTDSERRTFVKQSRLKRWLHQSMTKIKEFEDKKAFQGQASLGVVGFVGADSHDLGEPTGIWDVDTGNNGVLNNARDDLLKVKDRFINKGFDPQRPIHIALTNYAYSLLQSTMRLYDKGSNLKMWYEILPEGSKIYASNNVQASVTANANTMCAFIDVGVDKRTGEQDEDAYSIFSSGIEQGIHQKGIWQKQYGIREKYSVKVLDDAYVCYMDVIDTTT